VKTKRKKLIIIMLGFLCAVLLFFILDNDRYITENIRKIDQANTISIISDKGQSTYDFDKKMIDLVSYGGIVIKADNFIEGIFKPYGNILDERNLSIIYKNGDAILVTAKVFNTNDESDKYILYMDNVYWTNNENINELLDLVQ